MSNGYIKTTVILITMLLVYYFVNNYSDMFAYDEGPGV